MHLFQAPEIAFFNLFVFASVWSSFGLWSPDEPPLEQGNMLGQDISLVVYAFPLDAACFEHLHTYIFLFWECFLVDRVSARESLNRVGVPFLGQFLCRLGRE